MNDGILKRIKELADDLARRFPVESIMLFGSFAEENPEPNDIDLFLIGDLSKSEVTDWIVEYCISRGWYADGLPHVQVLCEEEASPEIIREVRKRG